MSKSLEFTFGRWRAAGLVASALLAACGGGGGDAGSVNNNPTTAPSSYAQGAITGFGSVIVGGVRYDDSSATVSDEDGNALASSALKLGVMVQVDAGNVDRVANTAKAMGFRVGAEVLGPVAAINVAAATVVVLGQTVTVTSSTVFDSTLAGGLAALTAGAVVEVHGIAGTTAGSITATRIEAKTAVTAYRVRGTVAALNTTAKTFTLGTALISYAGLAAADVPAALANGLVVRAVVQTVQLNGAWVATALRGGKRAPDVTTDAHVEGTISVFTSSTSFEIAGLKVDATNATFPDGKTGVVLGARVEVTGTVTAGVLVATKVEVEEARDGGQRPLELHGTMSNLNATDKTFALRGVTVWFGGTVTYTGGTVADLANGKTVEVFGVLSADRTRLEAKRIGFNKS